MMMDDNMTIIEKSYIRYTLQKDHFGIVTPTDHHSSEVAVRSLCLIYAI